MVKKITKYLKFVVCCALILSLIAPSYAALSASDGSAFVTKAEFDSALADFNARLTTFEAGINSKIDSQVTSYLDRNGIWNGAEQELWDFTTDPLFETQRNKISEQTGDQWALTKLDMNTGSNSYSYWSPLIGAAQNSAIPIIKNVSKSGLLAYNIPIIWWQANAPSYGNDFLLTSLQTELSNINFQPNLITNTIPINLTSKSGTFSDPISGFPSDIYNIAIPYYCSVIDTTTCDFFSVSYQSAQLTFAPDSNASLFKIIPGNTVADTDLVWDVSAGTLDATSFAYRKQVANWKKDNTSSYPYASLYFANPIMQWHKNYIGGSQPWSGSVREGTLKWYFSANFNGYNVTVLSGYTFVKKNQPWLICPGSGCGLIWMRKDKPVASTWVRTSGTKLKLDVY